jgi:hypothetical protein
LGLEERRGEERRVKKFNGKERTPPLKNNPKKRWGWEGTKQRAKWSS